MFDANHPIAFAHRGGGYDALDQGMTENTVEAFLYGASLGYSYLETDVRAASDGTLYAWHGVGIERVFAWRPLDVNKAKMNGHRVDTLEDIISALPKRVYLSVDIKHWRAIDPLVRVVKRTNSADRLLIGSFSNKRVRHAEEAIYQAMGKRVHTGMATVDFAKLLTNSKRRAGRRFQTSRQACWAPYTLVTPALVATAHSANVAVLAWTVNNRADMEKLLDMGVDGILTDRLRLLKEVLQVRGQWY
jgi:glycerophosphoryl diester phosphodiesterase